MTSKTFKSAMTDNRELEVDVIFSKPRLLIKEFDGDNTGFVFAPSDAPALALAILEAAGVESPYYNLKDAVDNLRQHVEREAQHAAEAQAQAESEAEALELFNVVREHDGEPRVATWDGLHAGTMEVYLLLARRARELAKEATK